MTTPHGSSQGGYEKSDLRSKPIVIFGAILGVVLLFTGATRPFRPILYAHIGLVDAFRMHCPDPGFYTWWDYRMLGFQKDDGLRIDHVLLSEPLAERCRSATIVRDERKGQQPSDHVPVVVELDL